MDLSGELRNFTHVDIVLKTYLLWIMLNLLLAMVMLLVPFTLAPGAQVLAPENFAGTSITHQYEAEDTVSKSLQTIRLRSDLPRIKRVPASESELQLTCTAALTGKDVRDPELGNLHTYTTSDLTTETEYLKVVALGTYQFPDGGPRHPVYSDKRWPRYSVAVFIDQSSTPEHTVYRVGVARRPSAFVEWLAPISGDDPIRDVKDWKKQVVPACQAVKR